MKKVVNLGNGEVNVARPKRRRFTADYKLKILAEVDACKGTGQGAVDKREVFSMAPAALRSHWVGA